LVSIPHHVSRRRERKSERRRRRKKEREREERRKKKEREKRASGLPLNYFCPDDPILCVYPLSCFFYTNPD
jgi:hypothetical protein